MNDNIKDIEADILHLVSETTRDWDFSGTIGMDTLLFSELGFESLDLVVFATAIQKHFQKQMPFAELFAVLGEKEKSDLAISELVEFVSAQLSEKTREAVSS